MTTEEAKFWKEGYEAGVKMVFDKYKDSIKIGDVIIEIMYNRFQTVQEDD